MSEKPIIFSNEMVKAILEGRKMVTRRVIKPQPLGNPTGEGYECSSKYQKGDILWVKETLERYKEDDTNYYELRYKANRKQVSAEEPENWNPRYKWYKGTTGDIQFIPSIHMPKWAARIWLKVLSERIEKLQEITEEDAIKEGLTEFFWDEKSAKIPHIAIEIAKGRRWWKHVIMKRNRQYSAWDSPIKAYKELWDDLNFKRGCPWDSNPQVRRLEFMIEKGLK